MQSRNKERNKVSYQPNLSNHISHAPVNRNNNNKYILGKTATRYKAAILLGQQQKQLSTTIELLHKLNIM